MEPVSEQLAVVVNQHKVLDGLRAETGALLAHHIAASAKHTLDAG